MELKAMLERYCAYQERCQKEVRNKLYESGATRAEVDELTVLAIGEGWIDEERYARAFARGKFRMKQWGKRKIVYELKLHQISEYCIARGLSEIDEDEYHATVMRLAEKKMAEFKSEKNIFRKRAKLQAYLSQKGYEHQIVNEMLQHFLG